jgi:hypothetical protein
MAAIAAALNGARPRLVWRMTPVALTTLPRRSVVCGTGPHDLHDRFHEIAPFGRRQPGGQAAAHFVQAVANPLHDGIAAAAGDQFGQRGMLQHIVDRRQTPLRVVG